MDQNSLNLTVNPKDIPEGLLINAIAVALAQAFTPERKDQLIRDVVRAHLTVKRNAYDKNTILDDQVGALIRQIASEKLREEVESLRPAIEAEIVKALGPNFKTSIVSQVASALQRISFNNLSVQITSRPNDDE